MIQTKRGLYVLLVTAGVLAATLATAARQPEIGPDEVRVQVSGIVRDPMGQPVKGAVVVAGITPWSYGLPEVVGRQVVRTDPNGRYRFSLVGHEAIVPQSGLTLCAFKEPFSPVCQIKNLSKPDPQLPPNVDQAKAKVKIDAVRQVEVAALAGDVELVLEAAAPFVGSVKNQAGQPVEGANVRFDDILHEAPDGTVTEMFLPREELIRGTPLESLYPAKSDKAGKFRFPALPLGSRLLLLVEAKGMADVRTRSFGSGRPGDPLEGYLPGTEERPAEIVLEPEARVTGRVVTKLPGVKTSGLKVFAQDTDASQTHQNRKPASTDGEGRFTLQGLGESTINIFLDDHPAAGEWTYRAVPNLELSPGVIKDVEIELIRGSLAEGTVVDQDGRPVANAHVGLYGPMRPRSGAAIIGAHTTPDGRYRFRVPPGESYFYVSGPPEGYERLPVEESSQTVVIPEVAEVRVPPIPVRSLGRE